MPQNRRPRDFSRGQQKGGTTDQLRDEATTNQAGDADQSGSQHAQRAGLRNCRRAIRTSGDCETSQSATVTLRGNHAKVNSETGQLADGDIRNCEAECRSLSRIRLDRFAIIECETANAGSSLEQMRSTHAEVSN